MTPKLEAWCPEVSGFTKLHQEIKSQSPELAKRLMTATRVLACQIASMRRALKLKDREVERAKERAGQLIADAHVLALTDAAGIDPHGQYVYCLWGDNDERPIYVGMSSNLFGRLATHMADEAKRGRLTRITITPCNGTIHAYQVEALLIRQFRPELNVFGKANS